MSAKKKKTASNVLVNNKTARRNYSILDTFEAGIELKGTEVKSLRNKRGYMTDSFVKIMHGEAFVYHFQISPYEQGNRFNHDPLRSRKLLLHKYEISRLSIMTDRKGFAIIPLKAYLKNGRVKLEIAVGEGKMLYDKRDDIKKREHSREIERAVNRNNKN